MKKAFIITVICLSAIIIGLGVGFYINTTQLAMSKANLENLYQRSFYELVNNVNDIEADVSKLMVSNDAVSQKEILTSLKQQTSDAQSNLSLLPVNSNTINTTTRFINQLNGYCTSLLKYDTSKIKDKDSEEIKNIYEIVSQIKSELNNIAYRLMQGYNIIDNLDGNSELDNFSINFTGLSSDSIEYPSMIYDGPFSDALDKKEIKGLTNIECSIDEAKAFVDELFGKLASVEYIGETNGKFDTFDFNVKIKEVDFYVQVTKRGKFLLNISADTSDGEGMFSEEKAIEVAEGFASKLKLENMKSVWSATSNGVTYVNLAPVVNDIVFYPDIIKAKVDNVNGNIVGWEATSYAYNHTERVNLSPGITKEKAQEKISTNLSVKDIRLCVIPLEFGGEVLAYEFNGNYNGFTYYMYIDAVTGNQVKVLRVVQTDQGNLLL